VELYRLLVKLLSGSLLNGDSSLGAFPEAGTEAMELELSTRYICKRYVSMFKNDGRLLGILRCLIVTWYSATMTVRHYCQAVSAMPG